MQPPRQKRTVGSVLNKVIQRTNANTRRLRVLEQENMILKARLASIERDSLHQRTQLEKSLKDLENRLGSLDDKSMTTHNTIKEIIKEIKKLATTSKVRELETLIQLYNPLKSQFMTREEAERFIEEKFEEREG